MCIGKLNLLFFFFLFALLFLCLTALVRSRVFSIILDISGEALLYYDLKSTPFKDCYNCSSLINIGNTSKAVYFRCCIYDLMVVTLSAADVILSCMILPQSLQPRKMMKCQSCLLLRKRK